MTASSPAHPGSAALSRAVIGHLPGNRSWSLLSILSFLLVCSCTFGSGEPSSNSLERILESGKITMITQNDAATYYIYRDEAMGFEYDLAKAFADHLGVELEVITPKWNDMIPALIDGRGDFIAANMTITPSRRRVVDFSRGYMEVQQQVLVRKRYRGIQDIDDLEGKLIHVREGTSYEDRLLGLVAEGRDIFIQTHPDLPTEELIRRVAHEEILVTVADSNIALLNRRYYPDVKIAFPINDEESLGWAVRKGDRELLEKINLFFDTIEDNGIYGTVYERYYAGVEMLEYVDVKKFHQRIETRLPPFKPIIEDASSKHGLDWKLVAAVIYQESQFNPRARSHTGVRGLMQVTRRTAAEMGITNRLDPAQSVWAGVKYLAGLYDRFDDIPEDRNRMLFALASYNVGYGHVRDAQGLAVEMEMDPGKWSSMEKVLPLLSYPKYYQRTRYGYARGSEPVRYVERVMLFYDILRWVV